MIEKAEKCFIKLKKVEKAENGRKTAEKYLYFEQNIDY